MTTDGRHQQSRWLLLALLLLHLLDVKLKLAPLKNVPATEPLATHDLPSDQEGGRTHRSVRSGRAVSWCARRGGHSWTAPRRTESGGEKSQIDASWSLKKWQRGCEIDSFTAKGIRFLEYIECFLALPPCTRQRYSRLAQNSNPLGKMYLVYESNLLSILNYHHVNCQHH